MELSEMILSGQYRQCTKCKEWKLKTEFGFRAHVTGGLKSNCRACNRASIHNSHYRLGYLGLPITAKAYYWLQRKYEATHQQIENYVYTVACDLCSVDLPIGSSKNKHFDHCHTTGKHRGVLCNACNSNRLPGIEAILHDSKLRQALEDYLGIDITIEPREE